jgi:guanidinopropionase
MALQDHREDGLDRMPTARKRERSSVAAPPISPSMLTRSPVYAPGTGTPEPGGLTTLEAQRLIRDLGSLDFVGADLVEVSPPFDTGGITSMTAATILFELLCVLAQARVQREPMSRGPGEP